MGGGGGGGLFSRWRGAAAKMMSISFSCVSFPPSSDNSSHYPPTKTISCSAVDVTGDKPEENKEKQESTILADKNLCAICLEHLDSRSSSGCADNTGGKSGDKPSIFTAQCSHSFHFQCISSNVRHGNVTCPICRAEWTELPRSLKMPPPSKQSDPILRILDDSIATSRVNRRSLRAARYNDDDPIEPASSAEPVQPCLRFALTPSPVRPYPCVHKMPLHHHCQQTTTSPSGQRRAYLGVRLAPQPAMDLVLVASPNGPHLRLMKQAMALVVFSLRAIDRLAIVTNSNTNRPFPLKRMSSHGKRMTLQVVDRLCYVNGADPIEGLQQGIKILEDRTQRNPSTSILHLSDNPIRHRFGAELDSSIRMHHFHVGVGYGMPNGFAMQEFEEFLARLLGGVIGDTQLRIGKNSGMLRLGELRGGEERRIPLDFVGDCGFLLVGYSYLEGGSEDQLRTGEAVVEFEDRWEARKRELSIGARRSCTERWDYADPFMARRWAKHLHVYNM